MQWNFTSTNALHMETNIYQNVHNGNKVTFLKTAKETNGKSTLIEFELAAKQGTIKHFHKSYTETIIILNNELTLCADGHFYTLRNSQNLQITPGVVHFYRNGTSTPTKFLIHLQPGQPAFEKALMIDCGLARDGLTNKKGVPQKFSHRALLATMFDTHLPGALQLLTLLFRITAKLAMKNGELSKLITRYC